VLKGAKGYDGTAAGTGEKLRRNSATGPACYGYSGIPPLGTIIAVDSARRAEINRAQDHAGGLPSSSTSLNFRAARSSIPVAQSQELLFALSQPRSRRTFKLIHRVGGDGAGNVGLGSFFIVNSTTIRLKSYSPKSPRVNAILEPPRFNVVRQEGVRQLAVSVRMRFESSS
jgi:hypothetical protein